MDQKPADECCPPFDAGMWNEKLFEWDNKTFIRDRVFTLFYIPMNFGTVIKRLLGKAENAGADMPDWLCLSDHTSKWGMDLYLATDRHVSGAENITLSGQFLSKVYEGPYKDTGKWCKDFEEYAASRGFSVDKWYMWYTTCPKCSKKYGKNYVAVIAKVAPRAAV